MQDIQECCDLITKKRFHVIRLRNDIKELQEYDNDERKHWTSAEQDRIQSLIDEKQDMINYLMKKIETDKTCCSIVSKVFLKLYNP
jgi:hypothetical protein